VYVVNDDVRVGNPDQYGIFSSREAAQQWIDRQRERKYPWADGLVIEEWPLDTAKDLR
jgi:hypothetical protein